MDSGFLFGANIDFFLKENGIIKSFERDFVVGSISEVHDEGINESYVQTGKSN